MTDDALREIAAVTDSSFEDLRGARHLRNALAHGEIVNRVSLMKYQLVLAKALGEQPVTEPAEAGPSREHAYPLHAWLDPRLEQEMLANAS